MLDLANGDRFTVAVVRPEAVTLTDGRRTVELPADRPLHVDLADRMGSRQPRIARLENRDPETTLEFQMKALFAANPATREDFRRLVDKWVAATGGVGAKSRSVVTRGKAAGIRAKANATVARKVKL